MIRSPTETLEDYKAEFGYMGNFLFSSVTQMREQERKQAAALLASNPPPAVAAFKTSGSSAAPPSSNIVFAQKTVVQVQTPKLS